jgi:hypothetical protein
MDGTILAMARPRNRLSRTRRTSPDSVRLESHGLYRPRRRRSRTPLGRRTPSSSRGKPDRRQGLLAGIEISGAPSRRRGPRGHHGKAPVVPGPSFWSAHVCANRWMATRPSRATPDVSTPAAFARDVSQVAGLSNGAGAGTPSDIEMVRATTSAGREIGCVRRPIRNAFRRRNDIGVWSHRESFLIRRARSVASLA